MPRLFYISFLFSSSMLLGAAPKVVVPDGPIEYSRDVRPIINSHCIACHGGVKKSGGVSFLFREEALEKGESGNPTVLPGDPDASEMIKRIITDDPKTIMPQPQHGRPLNEAEVEILTRWVKEGAKWGDHWSFEIPERQDVPEVKEKDWVKTPIDAFLLANMEEQEIKHAPVGKPSEIIRRLTFDLIGLPPTLSEIEKFEKAFAADPDKAMADKADELMARSQFGERWAVHWLDVARYADSEGLGVDNVRLMHPFRDWVVKAFNDDMPFDEFTIKQMAGDLLPESSLEDKIATSFHRLTQSNGEGGTDDEEFRVMALMDRVSTTWQAWQGVTFGCVQCHSHPYEPIRHEEYFTFMSFFNNTRDLDLEKHHPRVKVPHNPSKYSQANELQNEILAVNEVEVSRTDELRKSTTWKTPKTLEVSSSKVKVKTTNVDGRLEFQTTGTVPVGTVLDFKFKVSEDTGPLTAIHMEVMPEDMEKAIHTGEWAGTMSRVWMSIREPGTGKFKEIPLKVVLGDDANPPLDPQQSLNKKSKEGWGPHTKIYRKRHVVFLLDEPLEAPVGSEVKFQILHRINYLAAFPLVTRRGSLAISDDTAWLDWYNSDEAVQLREKRESAQAKLKSIPSIDLPIMAELPEKLKRDMRMFKAGNWLEKLEKPLQPNVPASLNEFKPANPDQPTRLDLAKWMVDPKNPLTARVAVNRIWEQIFGYGIVVTLEDFGSSGELPNHPALLDDLAVRFRTDMKWSTKTLIREMVLSNVYRQSSKVSKEASDRDPRNYDLARGPRNRLTAEMVRDNALAVSDLLVTKVGGGVSYPPVPKGGYTAASNRKDWYTNKVGDEKRYRRAIYTYAKRSSPYPSLIAFDAPSREVCSTRRITSNTPISALTTLNDPAFAEKCAALARRVNAAHPDDTDAQLKMAYQLTTSHDLKEPKFALVKDLYQNAKTSYDEQPELAEQLKADSHVAALIAVATVLLNLDESLTK